MTTCSPDFVASPLMFTKLFRSNERNEKNSALYLREFIGVETAALTFRTKQYSTGYSSHICYGKRFCNDFFLNHNTIALVRNCLKLLSCVVIETALGRNELKESIILTVSFQLENVPFNIKSYRFECKDCNACSQTIMTHHFAFG